MRSTRILLRRMNLDLRLQPGWYGALSVQILVTILMQFEFARAIGSVGLDPAQSAVYEISVRLLTGVYGTAAVQQLFSMGPGYWALWTGMIVPVVYLLFGAVTAIGSDRRSGLLELVLFAPVHPQEYVDAVILRDALALGSAILVGAATTSLGALVFNFPLGWWLVAAVLSAAATVFLLLLWGTIAGRLTASSPSAIAAFIAVCAVFILLHLVRTAAGVESGGSVWGAIGSGAGIVSPFLYGEVIYDGARTGEVWRAAVGVIGAGVMGILLLAVHRLIGRLERRRM